MFASPSVVVTSLTCERRYEPLGIDVPAPRLAWTLRAEGRNRRQIAYEVRVGSKPGAADLWQSGRVGSDESAGVAYNGYPLRSSQRAFWQVRIWDERGVASRWSPLASWTAGILRPQDWQARWIGHVGEQPETLLMRREFAVRKGLKRALVHVTGMGHYEMSLNGRKVGEDLLTPGWTNYRKTVLYDTYDVTKLLKPGANAAGLFLGNGMFNVHPGRYTKFLGTFGPQRALAQIELTYSDGGTETVPTDARWSSHAGPITFSSVFGGEDYDLRLEPKGWDAPKFKESWPAAALVDGPGGALKGAAFAAPPIQAIETLKPRARWAVKPNVQVFDLGQNASLMIRLIASGPAGSIVRVTPSELLNPDGSVNKDSTGRGPAYWQMTLDGKKTTFFPKFFYHGARYLQVELLPNESGAQATVSKVEGVVVHSTAPEVGEFACSNELFNRIHELVRWAQRSNTVSVLTDCPHRERLGWLEQYHLNGPSLRYEHDLSTLFSKTMQDMADSQRDSGLVPDIAPEYVVFREGFLDSPEWGSAVVLVPWQQYQFHRDTALLAQHYETMKRYVEYLRSRSTNGIVSHGLGDWFDIGPGAPGYAQLTPVALTATAFYYQDTAILAQVAEVLGYTADAALFHAEADSVREAFNATFFDPTKGFYSTGSQTANAIPLAMGLVEPQDRPAVLAQLVGDIQSRGNAITAGDVGYRYVLRALADNGRSDVVYAMNNQTDKPGYGYQLKMGATSLTEAWDANPAGSQNHFMLGQIMEWFYHDLAGIQPGDGFRRFTVAPTPVEGLSWAGANYQSEYGLVSSVWKRTNAGIVYEIVVPPNSTAEARLPAGTLTENGQTVPSEPMAGGLRRVVLGSGRYRLLAKP